MVDLNVTSDVTEITRALESLGKNTKYLKKTIANKLGQEVVGAVKRGYSRTLKKRTRKLYQSIKKVVKYNGAKVLIYPVGAKHGFVLAKGATIRPKTKKVLTFKIGDKWIRKHEIVLKPIDWFTPSANVYLESRKPQEDMLKILAKEIEKAWK